MAKRILVGILIIFLPPLTTYAGFVTPPKNLDVQISPNGDVPGFSIPCEFGHNYTTTLVHQDGGKVWYSFGPVQRRYCDGDSVTYSPFSIYDPLKYMNSVEGINWNYVHTPLEFIVKDTTDLGLCYGVGINLCPPINLSGAFNFYDHSVYLASSTYWTTVASGPIFDSNFDHIVWFNSSNGDGSFNISTTTNEVATGTAVVFFPGVMGSRLYEESGGVETEDWASILDSNHAKLELDSNGKDVHGLYTKDDTQSVNDESETGITDEIYGQNIYNSFINDLRNWKEEGTIKDYAFIPYDWRLSLEDIITKGATTTDGKLTYDNNQNFSESYILKKLRELGSESAHITLIGHSNGGLVIKALVQKLEETNDPLYYKIDKIIFVAVPQVGTPDAVVNLLHGTSLGHGFVMTNQRSRQLSENFPMAYNLAPSNSYFGLVSNSVVTFENFKGAYDTQILRYGLDITNSTELKDFVSGAEGRVKPSYSETNSPNIGNSSLYTQAEVVHAVLDSWQPASTTKVIQVAGWGEETTAGIKEKTCWDMSVEGYHKCISPVKVVDGDGTVVVPSALWISTSTPNVERWWVDLKEYANKLANKKRIHRDILEVKNLRDYIKQNILDNLSWVDPESILVSSTSTLIPDGSRLHYTLHSPLTLGVTDNQGRYTGLDPITKEIREEIPGVSYETIGDTQFVSVPSDLVGQVRLSGYDEGTFALDIEKQVGNDIVEETSFQGIPSSTSTSAVIDINPIVASTTLQLDQDGDGNIDKTLGANAGGWVIYDDQAPEISVSYSTTTNSVVFEGVDENPVIVTVGTSTVAVEDSQNNKSLLLLGKFKKESSEFELTLNNIIRNNLISLFSKTEIKFEISRNKKGIISELESVVKVSGKEYLTLKYSSERKITVIKEYKNGVYITSTRPGLVVEKVVTNGSGVNFVY